MTHARLHLNSFVLWITGLSGAGKSTIGKEVYQRLKDERIPLVFIDGDIFRFILGNDLGHDLDSRKRNALRISQTCKLLVEQNVSVVCATMSLYEEIWAWNRKNIPGYLEIYLKVTKETLLERDPKNIYRRVQEGTLKDVIGFDLPFTEPTNPDLVVDNRMSAGDLPSRRATEIIEFLKQRAALV